MVRWYPYYTPKMRLRQPGGEGEDSSQPMRCQSCLSQKGSFGFSSVHLAGQRVPLRCFRYRPGGELWRGLSCGLLCALRGWGWDPLTPHVETPYRGVYRGNRGAGEHPPTLALSLTDQILYHDPEGFQLCLCLAELVVDLFLLVRRLFNAEQVRVNVDHVCGLFLLCHDFNLLHFVDLLRYLAPLSQW